LFVELSARIRLGRSKFSLLKKILFRFVVILFAAGSLATAATTSSETEIDGYVISTTRIHS